MKNSLFNTYDFKEEILKNNIYTITLTYKNTLFTSNGKDFDLEIARKKAYGEFYERFLCKNFFEDFFIDNLYPDAKNTKFLNKNLYEFYEIENLEKEDLIDFNSSNFEILSIPFESNKKEIIYFPINLVQNLYASNGMAFHFDRKKALFNALFEVMERFVKFYTLKNIYPLPKINHKYNNEFIQIYDATLEGKYPVMAASFIKDNKIILTFGSDFDLENAINKAYLELFQGRDNLENAGEIIDNEFECKESFNLEKHFISSDGDVHKDILKGEIKPVKWKFEEKFDYFNEYYIKDYSFKDYYAFHLIVPDFSEIYPIDDLIYNNKNQGKFYRDFVLNYKNYNKSKIIENFENLNPYLDLGKFIGVEFEENLTIYEFIERLKINKFDYKFSKRYLNIVDIPRRAFTQ